MTKSRVAVLRTEPGTVLSDYHELMNLADTQMRTQFSTKALNEHFQMLKSGITGRI